MEKIDYSIYYLNYHSDSLEHYEQWVEYYKRNLGKFIPDNKEIKILDVGCAIGLAMYALQKMGYKYVKGIDISPELVEIAKKRGLDVELVENSMEFLKENKNQFDIVLALDVLEHIPKNELLEFLRHINQSLKERGKFICTVPNANSTFASRWRYGDWTHHTSFTEDSIKFVLLNSGFKKVNVYEIEFFTKPKYPFIIRKSVIQYLLFKSIRLLRRLEAVVELGAVGKEIPLSLNIMVIAEK